MNESLHSDRRTFFERLATAGAAAMVAGATGHGSDGTQASSLSASAAAMVAGATGHGSAAESLGNVDFPPQENLGAMKKGVIKAADAIRYAMSLPVAVTVSGIDSLEVLRENLRTARTFVPMDRAERTAYEKQCADAAEDGRFELYKTTAKFEGPPGREQHGFPPKEEMPG